MSIKRPDQFSFSHSNSDVFDDDSLSFGTQPFTPLALDGHDFLPVHQSPPNDAPSAADAGHDFEPSTNFDLSGNADAKSGGAPGGGGGKPGGGGSGLLTTYTSGNPGVDNANEFNITVNFSGNWTASEQAVVKWAADFYSQIITADVRDDIDLSGHLVDDIVITVSTGRIDGNGSPLTGNTLAQTSNIVVRDAGTVDEWIPLTASIKLDSTDLNNASLAGTWDAIIAHEMGHALGFVGAIFTQLHLVDGSGNFIGTQAMTAYGGAVPLEDSGGAGTAGSHWDEVNFKPNGEAMSNELMTGYFTPGEVTLLSDTTVGAFADLGYTVQDPSVGIVALVVDSHLLVS